MFIRIFHSMALSRAIFMLNSSYLKTPCALVKAAGYKLPVFSSSFISSFQNKHFQNHTTSGLEAVPQNSQDHACDHILCPSTYQTHTKCTSSNKCAGPYSASPSQDSPTLIAQEILTHQIDQRRERKETRRNGIHNAHHQQAHLRSRRIQSVGSKTECLTNWGRTSICKGHDPRLVSTWSPRERSDA